MNDLESFGRHEDNSLWLTSQFEAAERGEPIYWDEKFVQALQKGTLPMAKQVKIAQALDTVSFDGFLKINDSPRLYFAVLPLIFASKVRATWSQIQPICKNNKLVIDQVTALLQGMDPLPIFSDIAPSLNDANIDARVKTVIASRCRLITADEYFKNPYGVESAFLRSAFVGNAGFSKKLPGEQESQTFNDILLRARSTPNIRFYDILRGG